MTDVTFTNDKLPPIDKFVVGVFRPMYRSQNCHVCDCRWTGSRWVMHGNDSVKDIFVGDPYAWFELPNIPDTDWEDEKRVVKQVRATAYSIECPNCGFIESVHFSPSGCDFDCNLCGNGFRVAKGAEVLADD